ncbi:MAG: type II secretion system protein [Myxococcota bacterium]
MRRRGFTLLEVLTVVGIVGVASALAVPTLESALATSRLNGAARAVIGSLRQARAAAIARQDTGAFRVENAGIRVDTSTRYVVFLDPDDDPSNGNEQTLLTVNLADHAPDGHLHFLVAAVGLSFRFARDGSTTAGKLTIEDSNTNQVRAILVSAAGFASLE